MVLCPAAGAQSYGAGPGTGALLHRIWQAGPGCPPDARCAPHAHLLFGCSSQAHCSVLGHLMQMLLGSAARICGHDSQTVLLAALRLKLCRSSQEVSEKFCCCEQPGSSCACLAQVAGSFTSPQYAAHYLRHRLLQSLKRRLSCRPSDRMQLAGSVQNCPTSGSTPHDCRSRGCI